MNNNNSIKNIKFIYFEVTLRIVKSMGVSLVAQLVKNLPAMQETLVQFLGWADPLKKG